MRLANQILDQVKADLTTTVPGILGGYRMLNPLEVVPDIRELYLEEYDYEQAFNTPALLLFESDPLVEGRTAGLYLFRLPIDIVAWDTADASGMAQLHRRLKTYRAAVIEAMLSVHFNHNGLWHGVEIGLYGASPPTPMSTGAVGRALGVQLHFHVEESY